VHYYSQSLLLADQMHLIVQNLNFKIYVVWKVKWHSSQTVVPYTHAHAHTHTHTPLVQKLRCQTPNKHTTNISEPLRISVK